MKSENRSVTHIVPLFALGVLSFLFTASHYAGANNAIQTGANCESSAQESQKETSARGSEDAIAKFEKNKNSKRERLTERWSQSRSLRE